jgi:hypothetical protein
MEHKEAVQLQAAEKYVLGELTGAQRDEYEEHYFDCVECALDVKAAAAFVETGRAVLRAERGEAVAAKPVRPSRGWLFWLRPAMAVPALAALLAVIIYQNAVTIPQAKRDAGLNAGQFLSSTFSLQTANTRGGEELKIRVRPEESFSLKFDFTPAKVFDSYHCKLEDESGRTLLQTVVPGTSVNQEAQFVVPGGLVKPGKYRLVFTGAPSASGEGRGEEVLWLGFLVEFLA